jgi:hypothetical protein
MDHAGCHVDHTGCHPLVLLTMRPTRVVPHGCQSIGYVDHAGCHQLVNPTMNVSDAALNTDAPDLLSN